MLFFLLFSLPIIIYFRPILGLMLHPSGVYIFVWSMFLNFRSPWKRKTARVTKMYPNNDLTYQFTNGCFVTSPFPHIVNYIFIFNLNLSWCKLVYISLHHNTTVYLHCLNKSDRRWVLHELKTKRF